MYQIFQDCCGLCPTETIATEEELQNIDKYFVKGELKFIDSRDRAPPIKDYNEWVSDAYIKSENLKFYDAIAKGDIGYIRELVDDKNDGIDINEKDYLNRSPLHLAVLNGHLEIVDLLLENGAKITAKMIDGRTSVHLASQSGYLDILKLLFKKSKLNEQLKNSKIQESNIHDSGNNNDNDNDDDSDKSLDILDTKELDNNYPKDDDDTENNEKDVDDDDDDDIIDINSETWDHKFTALDYAIIFGNIDVVKYLISVGADVRCARKSKIKKFYVEKKLIYYPLDLCLLVYDQQIGMQIATILLENGATTSQVSMIIYINKY